MQKNIYKSYKKAIFFALMFDLIFLYGCGNKKIQDSDNTEFLSMQQDVDSINSNETVYQDKMEFIGVVDTYSDAKELKNLFDSTGALEKMIKFNQFLNSEFSFIEIYNQPLQSKFYWDMDDKFLEEYGGTPMKNQEIEINGEKCYISTLNSMQVNLNTYNYFFDFIGEGRGFREDDFQYKDKKVIPIIMGNDYKSYYSIGDNIELNYLEKDFDYEIIGFFEHDMEVKIENSKYDMNTYLCVPFFELDTRELADYDKLFWLRYYQEKNSGYIEIDDIDSENEENVIEKYREIIQNNASEIGLKYSVMDIIYNISGEK